MFICGTTFLALPCLHGNLALMNWPLNVEENKILVTSLVTSLFTAALTEPIRAVIQQRLKRRALRKAIYWEIASSCSDLIQRLEMAQHPDETQRRIGSQFERWGFRRVSYDLAMNDTPTFYQFGYYERYAFSLIYPAFESVIRECENEKSLICAASAIHQVLSDLKTRHLSERLMLRVGPEWVRRYFKQHLPSTHYIDIAPMTLLERLRRRNDRYKYWIWAMLTRSDQRTWPGPFERPL